MSRKQSSRAKRLSSRLILLLVFVTLAAYLNAWPDNLTLDDKAFADSERFTGLSLSDTSRFFTEDLWAANGGTTGLYRPLLLISIAADALIYGDWAAGYHLTNILLHLLVTLLVFGFIRYLLLVSGGQTPLSDRLALLAAMVFGIHPIHAEVVNSIFNRSGMLVSAGVVGGLWWFLRTLESKPNKAWSGLAAIYLFILLCKESAVILPALAVVMLWLFTPGDWRIHLRRSLPVFWLLIPLGIYLGLRAHALDVHGAAGGAEITQMSLLAMPGEYSYSERLLAANSVWFESLKMFVWPHPLQIYHPVFSVNTWLALVLQLVLLGLAIRGFIQKRYGLIAGLAFFYIAMLPASRIIASMGGIPHLAERYIYLPSVGLAIALAFGLKWLTQRFNLRTAMAAVFMALVILTPITWARNADWASDVLLFESDYRKGNRQRSVLHMLVSAHLKEKNYSRATEICDRHAAELKKPGQFNQRCGLAYGQLGRFDDAEQ